MKYIKAGLLAAALGAALIIHTSDAAEEAAKSCVATDTACLIAELNAVSDTITEASWRDQTLRETAKLMARQKNGTQAASLIGKITNPDTKAMTIRGIGMQAAKTDMTKTELDALFTLLRQEAEKIEHPPSYGIALTYIAMAQAFAKDDAGAMKTASDMTNPSLRNKAFAESAEIQAERGDLDEALKSIAAIEDKAFRNKAHFTIVKIFTEDRRYDEALAAARQIDNPYQRAQGFLDILAKQISPEEVSVVE